MSLRREEKVCIGLRFLASNAIHGVLGDAFCISLATAHRVAWDFIDRVLAQRDHYIFWLQGPAMEANKRRFFDDYGMPGVAGALDCTHVRLPVSAEDQASFSDRHGVTSLNVQAVCNYAYEFMHICAEWPGSVHDSRVLRESTLPASFEEGRLDCLLLGDGGYGNGKPRAMGSPDRGPRPTIVGGCRHFKERMNILLTESIVPLGHNESDTGGVSLGE